MSFFFLYSKLQQVLIGREIFSVLVKSYSILPVHSQHTMQKALFLHFLCLYWSPIWLFKPWVWKKKSLFWRKIWKKSWILDPKIWTYPVHMLQVKFDFRFILIKPRLILNFHFLSPSPKRQRKLRINLGWKILTLNQIWPVTYTLKAALKELCHKTQTN